MTAREAHLVELVDETGAAIGKATVAEAHAAPGRLHRAFSVILQDPSGRVLLQERAAAKTRFAGRWANACCGHPPPDVPVAEAAGLRLTEELGVAPMPFTELGVHTYRADDPATGRIEHEYDHVLLGTVPADLVVLPDPAEVAGVRWITPAALRRDLEQSPESYAPWLAGVIALLG
jgi:isopentenyl-diphosphate delta-isomerase